MFIFSSSPNSQAWLRSLFFNSYFCWEKSILTSRSSIWLLLKRNGGEVGGFLMDSPLSCVYSVILLKWFSLPVIRSYSWMKLGRMFLGFIIREIISPRVGYCRLISASSWFTLVQFRLLNGRFSKVASSSMIIAREYTSTLK